MSSTLKTPLTHEIEARVMPVPSTMTGLELTRVFVPKGRASRRSP